MNNQARQWVFRHYWWLSISLGILAIAIVHYLHVERRWELTATTIGIVASVLYFVQKQKLEELQLFERLFTSFNNRYHLLLPRMQEILREPATTLLSRDQLAALDQYFNLCAEEYLFYSQGRILQDVWRTWCRGIYDYLENARVSEYWDRQERTNFHYGLTRAAVTTTAEQ